MVSKLILLLGVLISVFIAYSCIQKNRQALDTAPTHQAADPVTQPVTQNAATTPVSGTKVSELEQPTPTDAQAGAQAVIAQKDPSLSFTTVPARTLDLTISKADEDSAFTDRLQNYCKKPSCSLSLHLKEDVKRASWGKEAAALISFMTEHHVSDASVHIAHQKLTVGGTFASKEEEDAFEKLLSGFLDKDFLIDRQFTHQKPKAPATEQEERASVAPSKDQEQTPSSDAIAKEETPKIKVRPAKPKPQAAPVKTVQVQESLEDLHLQQIKQIQNNINALLKTHPIYFKRNSNDLTLSSKKILDKIIDLVNKNSEEITRLRIMGHTDASGSAAYNKRLSQKRAERVRDYLISHHINIPVLEAIGYGEERPISKNRYARENRRVEIEISKEDSYE